MKLFNLFKKPKPIEKEIEFEGHNLCFSEGTSIVDRYLRDGYYEKEFVEILVNQINLNKTKGAFIDIGANIGMISLTCINRCGPLKVYAFEPGQHQYDLFKKTIERNKLNVQVELFNIALSDKKGQTNFYVHDTKHVSGDGFVDTERAGKTKVVKVDTDTLDNWWIQNNQPPISVIKIDTEGSEFYILKGAKEMLKKTEPFIYLEINDKNIRNYPFKVNDLLVLIDELGYYLNSLRGDYVNADNILGYIRENDTFFLVKKEG